MCDIPYEKSFASNPKAQFWHPTKNGNIKPNQVSVSTKIKYWFKCGDCYHPFEVSPEKIRSRNTWCPYCCKPCTKLCDTTIWDEYETCMPCFQNSFASNPKSNNWSNKNTIQPRYIQKGSEKKFWLDCSICNHAFECRLYSINSGVWCSYCNGDNLCDNDLCLFCKDKSFVSNPMSVYWHPEKNGDITPRKVLKGTKIKYWFKCNVCLHDFDISLAHISNGKWCCYCAIPSKKLCDNEQCIMCTKRSFASHEKSLYWHPEKNGDITPRKVLKGTHIKYWFKCNICSHDFDISLAGITSKQSSWCGYCSFPPKKICNDENRDPCLNKSFAGHYRSKNWSKNNIDKSGNFINPRTIFKCSGIKYLFICENNHEFPCKLDNIQKGKWCPFCVNKTESKLHENIILIYPTLITQFKQDWCKKITYLPFDFCIPEYKIIIELDGRQHFQQISNWTSPEEQFKNDKYKENCANDNGYSVIRVLQEDVFYDTYDWIKEICDNIDKIKNNMGIMNIYLCKNAEYINY
jgi:very-short-patch-repair endonuclease